MKNRDTINEYKNFFKKVFEEKVIQNSRKSFVTKEIKGLQEHLIDLKEAHARPMNQRYLFGEFVSTTMVNLCEKELEFAKKVREKLNKKNPHYHGQENINWYLDV